MMTFQGVRGGASGRAHNGGPTVLDPTTSMAKLGQLLLARGWIGLDQLTRALKSQSVVGGRLGTCLLEMDVLREELLTRALSEQLGLPAASVEDLHGIPEEVISILPAKIARRCKAVPFRLAGNRVDVAMLDPRNLAHHDEIAFASSRRVRVHVASELRIHEALDKYFDEELTSRFAMLVDRLNRSMYLWSAEGTTQEKGSGIALRTEAQAPSKPARPRRSMLDLPLHAAAPPPSFDRLAAELPIERGPSAAPSFKGKIAPPTAPEVPSLSQTRSMFEPAAGPSVAVAPPPEAAAAPAPPPTPTQTPRPRSIPLTEQERVELQKTKRHLDPQDAPATLDDLEATFAITTDRDEIVFLSIGHLRRRFARALFFQIGRDQVSGWHGAGEGVDETALSEFRAAFDQPSIFLNLRQGNSLYLGPLPPMPIHRRMAELWGGTNPERTAMVPIVISGRPVAVVYVDGSEAAWSGFELESLRRLARLVADAFERCIREKKRAVGAR